MEPGRSGEDGEADARSVESYVILDEALQRTSTANSESGIMFPAGRWQNADSGQLTASDMLRSALNSAELTNTLMAIWKPETQPVTGDMSEEIPFKQGQITDFHDDDILFHYDRYLKDLMSLIVHKKSGFVAKTAAMDTFTWLCCLEDVILYPFDQRRLCCRPFADKQVWRWVINLLRYEDARIQSTALRGIRNLVLIDQYRRILVEHADFFFNILSYLSREASAVKHAEVYVFEIYHSILNADGAVPLQDVFVKALLLRMATEALPLEARNLGMKCVQSCLRSFENKEQLVETLLERGDLLTWLTLADGAALSDTLEAFFAILQYLSEEEERSLLCDVIGGNEVMEKLFTQLTCGFSDLETAVLDLLHRIAENLPNAFYDDFLDEKWITFQIVLEKGSKENKQKTLDILHKIAISEGPMKKNKPLPLPARGLPFIQLLTEHLTDQRFDIIRFMLSHYEGVLPVLTEAQMIAAVLCELAEDGWITTTQNLEKIKLFLGTVATETENPQLDFGSCLFPFLESALRRQNAACTRTCLQIGFDLLKKLDRGDQGFPPWMFEAGLVSMLTELMVCPDTLAQFEDLDDLFHVLQKTIGTMSQAGDHSLTDRNELCALLVLTLDSANVLGVNRIAEALTSVKRQQPRIAFVTETANLPSQLSNGGLSVEGMMVLHKLLDGWNPGDSVAFLESLLTVFLRCVLDRSANQLIIESSVLQTFTRFLGKLPYREMSNGTKRMVVSCLTSCSNKFHAVLADLIGLAGQHATENLWSLLIEGCDGYNVSSGDGQSIMALLKTVSTKQLNTGMEDSVARLQSENAELKTADREKVLQIRALEAKLEDMQGQLQEMTTRLSEQRMNVAAGNAESSQAANPTISQLESLVERLRRQVVEKDATISELTDRNERLQSEVRNRRVAYDDLAELVNNLHQKIGTYEAILAADGYGLDD